MRFIHHKIIKSSNKVVLDLETQLNEINELINEDYVDVLELIRKVQYLNCTVETIKYKYQKKLENKRNEKDKL